MVRELRANFPYFDAAEPPGSNHVFATLNDIGNCVAQWAPDAAEHSIFLTHFGK